MKKNLILILIILFAMFLRINNDMFMKGYVFDEIAIISVAKQSFPFGILFSSATIDYHAPLYSLLIHPFTYLSNEWIYIRFLNIIFTILNIIVFYLIGKEINSKKLGYILAFAMCVNHMQISTVAFVKFYCLTFLLTSISILYFIKCLKNKNSYTKLGIINSLFILSWTFSFVFVGFEYLILFLAKLNKKNIIKSILIASIGFIIYLPILLMQIKLSFTNIISPHGTYPSFSPFGFYAFLNDYLSPLLNYACAEETVEANSLLLFFLKKIILFHSFDYISFFSFLFLSLIPIILGIIGICLAIKNSKLLNKLLILAFLFILFFITLTTFEITGFVSLYLYTAGLIIIICAFSGLFFIKNKKLSTFLIAYLILTHIVITNYYPMNKRDDSRLKIYYVFSKYLKNYDNKTPIITTLGGRFLKLYFNDKNIFNYDYEEVGGSFKRNYIEIIYGDDIAKNANKYNFKDKFGKYILNNNVNPYFSKYIKENLYDKMKLHDKLVYVFYADDCPFIANENIIKDVILNKTYSYNLENSSLIHQLTKKENSNIVSETYVEDIIRSYSNRILVDELEKQFKRKNVKQYRMNNKGDYYLLFSSDDFPYSTRWIMENVLFGWVFVEYEKVK